MGWVELKPKSASTEYSCAFNVGIFGGLGSKEIAKVSIKTKAAEPLAEHVSSVTFIVPANT